MTAGGPPLQEWCQRGKPRIPSFWDGRVAEAKSIRNRITAASVQKVIRFFVLGGAMRALVINKLLSFQYRLGRMIGKKKARIACIFLERVFVGLFGREVYHGKK